MNKLSALIIAHNEEKQISECLENLNFVDEIIVILDNCRDKTEQISKKYTNKIFKGSWNIEGERRNFGIQKCSNDWIIEIDADERIPEILQKEIKHTISKSVFDYHIIPVDNFVGNKLVRHGWGAYFGKSAYPGLFRKKNKVWGKQRVHPRLKLIGKKGFSLKNPIKHYYCEDISDMIKKLDNYSSAKALDLLDENTKETGFRNFRRIFSRFWKCFILRKGYKENKIGILIAIIAGLYPLLSYVKYYFLKKND